MTDPSRIDAPTDYRTGIVDVKVALDNRRCIGLISARLHTIQLMFEDDKSGLFEILREIQLEGARGNVEYFIE